MDVLTHGPIDVTGLLAQVGGPAVGGTSLFLGTVRRGADDGPVEAIDYSAHDAMAEAEWHRIVAEAATRWPEGRFAVQHRLGVVATGEASIAVAVATPHRADAFAACEWIVEQAKARLPIWKKERFDDGTAHWRENAATHAGRGRATP